MACMLWGDRWKKKNICYSLATIYTVDIIKRVDLRFKSDEVNGSYHSAINNFVVHAKHIPDIVVLGVKREVKDFIGQLQKITENLNFFTELHANDENLQLDILLATYQFIFILYTEKFDMTNTGLSEEDIDKIRCVDQYPKIKIICNCERRLVKEATYRIDLDFKNERREIFLKEDNAITESTDVAGQSEDAVTESTDEAGQSEGAVTESKDVAGQSEDIVVLGNIREVKDFIFKLDKITINHKFFATLRHNKQNTPLDSLLEKFQFIFILYTETFVTENSGLSEGDIEKIRCADGYPKIKIICNCEKEKVINAIGRIDLSYRNENKWDDFLKDGCIYHKILQQLRHVRRRRPNNRPRSSRRQTINVVQGIRNALEI
ncbi:unnamed protein product [Mytilus coruscus]|uniref:Uncharacterized protein n=1 Tax=Mytilus coruscus TaxID=42192 RepID=A0A6J8CGU9_MYTCO|nr:unnamed protein product [Mytilus coruscus]